VDVRGRRVGENEAMWREINELTPPEPGVMNLVFCECGIVTCTERVSMTAGEYADVRKRSTTFVVAPGHELPDVERVVETNERFRIVDKEGEAALVAIRTDPR
jgi:hypothetical protein